MKTDWICVSNRLGRMRCAYLRAALAAIVALCGVQARADEPLLCVLVPHFKDEYWLSVAHGIEERAAENGLHVRFFEAGGYRALARQIAQLDECAALDPAAILIGAVSSDAPALLTAVGQAAELRPVIGLVNELHSDALVARVGVDWSDMGLALGGFLAARHPAGGPAVPAVLLSGPAEAGWVAPLEEGLRQGLAGSSIDIVGVYGADTGTAEQLRLLEAALADHADARMVIGSAPAIEAAMAVFAGWPERPELAATYLSHSVARGLVGDQVVAAPFDDPIRQGVLGVDAAAAAMRGGPVEGQISTEIVIFGSGAAAADIRLSPADFFPSIE